LIAAVGISKQGIPDYESLDEKPVHIIVMVAAGREQHAQHLRLLAYLTTLFKRRPFREELLAAPDSQAVHNLLINKAA
jgi:PTS system nitrogen regulatory IIA component